MSYTPTAIEVAFRAALVPALPAGVPLIFANQDGPAPAQTYATLLVTLDAPQGLRTQETSDAAGTAPDTHLSRIGQQRTTQISVQVFGPNAYAAASSLAALYEHPQIVYAAHLLGVELTGCDGTQRIPAALTTETEDRWLVTLRGAYHLTAALDVAAVETVVGTLYLDGDADPAGTLTVTAPE